MNWPMVKIKDVVTHVRNGASIKQSDSSGGLPVTRIETIATREVNLDKCGYADLGPEDYQDYRLACGDILISHINSEKHLGKCAIFESARSDVVHGMNLLCMRANDLVIPKFVFYYLSSTLFLSKIPNITKKSVNQASFTVTSFKELEIPLPSLDEQKRITAILDKADAIRRKRQQAIQLADDFLRAVFVEMFGDPNYNIKEASVLPMTEVFHIKTGNLNSNAAVVGGKYPFFTCAKEVYAIDDYAFDHEALLLAGNNAQADYDVKHYKGKFNAYQRTYVLTLKESTWSYPFFKFALEYQLSNLKRVSKGSNTKYITMEIMSRTMLPIPSEHEQLAFVQYFEKLEKLKTAYDKCLDKGVGMFSSLSQRAFTGQL